MTTRTRHPAKHARSANRPLTGLGDLLRLAARRDRVRLAVWVGSLTFLTAYFPKAIELAYPSDTERLSRVNLLKTPAGMILGGPMFGGNETAIGAMVANELMLTMIVAASIMSILTVVRHTRAEEESGAAELVMSSVVGRHARTAAAVCLTAMANGILAVTMTLAATAVGLPVIDSAAMALGITAAAMVFGAVAAVTAQLWRVSRAATAAAMGVLAVAMLVRGVGDVIDFSGSTLSWFSPIAWAQQMRAFVELRWWPLALLVALAATLAAAAAILESRRQYDAGIVRSRGGRPGAPAIRGVFALHLSLQRGLVISWSVGLFLAGLAFGSMTKSLQDAAAGNELLARVFATQGNDGMYTAMTQFLAAAATAFVAAGVLRLSADEQNGLGEPVLAGAVSRWRWLVTACLATLAGSAVLMLCAGVGYGLGVALTLGDGGAVLLLTGAALAQVPAMAVVAGVAAVAVAIRRPWVAWTAVAFVIVSLYLGALFRLPRWLLDASPVLATTAPTNVPVTALIVMVLAATALVAAAGAVYRHRDAA